MEKHIKGHVSEKKKAVEKAMREKNFMPKPKVPVLPKIPQGEHLIKVVKQDTVRKKRVQRPIVTVRSNAVTPVIKVSQQKSDSLRKD
jgi:hypothetical protein